VKLALCQTPSPAGDVELALGVIARAARAAAAFGAGMVLFPELFLPGYNQKERLRDLAEPADGPSLARVSAIARETGMAIVTGFAEREGERLYNAALAIGPDGGTLALFRKLQLFGPTENALFAPGEGHAHFDHAGHRFGLLVCYDVEFPEHVRALARRAVDVVLVPTANMEPYRHVARILVPARAAENDVTVAYCNYCGEEGDLAYTGLSVIAGPDGEPAAAAGVRGEALLITDLDAIRQIPEEMRSTQLRDLRDQE